MIRSLREDFEGSAFTSARLHTRGHPVAGAIEPPRDGGGDYVPGGAVRVEMKGVLPEGTPSGTWPAFWMLPSDNVRPGCYPATAHAPLGGPRCGIPRGVYGFDGRAADKARATTRRHACRHAAAVIPQRNQHLGRRSTPEITCRRITRGHFTVKSTSWMR